MSKWTTIVVFALLAGALVAYVLLSGAPPTTAPVPASFLRFAVSGVDAAEVRSPSGQVSLKRDDRDRERWRVKVNGAWVRARSASVEDLLNDLSRQKPVAFWKKKEVKAEERVKWKLDAPTHEVRITVGGVETRAAFGARTADQNNAYAEKDGDGDVYVVGYALVQAVEKADPGSLRENKPAGFGSFEAQRLEVAVRGGAKFTAEKGEGFAWEVREPYQGHADTPKVDQVLSKVLEIEVMDFVEDGAPDLDRYGLLDPAVTVSIRRQGREKPLVLKFGKEVPDTRRAYFCEEGEPSVYACETPVFEALKGLDPAALRDRNLLRLGWSRLDSLEFAHTGVAWTLRRNVDKWEVEDEKRERSPADGGEVDVFLDLLRNLQVERFLDGEDPSAHAIPDEKDAPGRLVLVGTDPTGNRRLLLGRVREDGLVPALLDGARPVVLVKGDILERMRRGWLQFRGREVLKVDLGEIRGLSRKTKDGEVSFTRVDGQWRAAGNGPEPNLENLQVAVSRLLTVHCDGYVERTRSDLGRFGLGESPRAAITLTLKKAGEAGERTATLQVGDEVPGSPGTYYARMADGEYVFRLLDEVAPGQNVVQPLLADFAKRPPEPPPAPPPPPKEPEPPPPPPPKEETPR